MSQLFDIQKANANVAKAIDQLKETVEKEYNDNSASHQKQMINADLTRIVNRISILSGYTPDVRDSSATQFPPATNVGGIIIEHKKPIVYSDLSPSDATKASFLEKVDKLYQEIDTMESEGVLNSYSMKDDQIVLRAVAKKAGLENYQEANLTIPFVEAIVKAKKEKEEVQKEEDRINSELEQQDKSTHIGSFTVAGQQDEVLTDNDNGGDHEITDIDLENYPQLKEDGFAVGDFVNSLRWSGYVNGIGSAFDAFEKAHADELGIQPEQPNIPAPPRGVVEETPAADAVATNGNVSALEQPVTGGSGVTPAAPVEEQAAAAIKSPKRTRG